MKKLTRDLKLLQDPQSGVDAAFIAGGVAKLLIAPWSVSLVSRIQSRFAQKEREYWNSELKFIGSPRTGNNASDRGSGMNGLVLR